jgi:RHS repeat-associated protein
MRKRWGERRVDFHWAGDQLVAESDASGRWRLYLYADALARTPLGFVDYDALDAPPNAGRRHVVFSDPIGTPCLIEDAAQRVVWRADLSPFGAAAVTGEIDFNLRFPGHYLDAELGLHYNRFRYYDPVLGRYLQSDPWGIAGGLNLYGYLTNPLAHADVRGLGGKDEHGTPNDCPHDKEGTEPPTPKKEKTPYPPPRTGQAQAECQHVVDTMAGMGMSKKKNQVVSVLTHDGDRVSVGISGENSTKNQAKATALQNKLNDGHDPPKYRVSTGSPAGIREVEGGNKPGVCGEPHAADSAHGHDRAITGGDTRWRGDDNPHPFTGENADGAPVHPSQMNPCATCGDPHNNDVYGNHANS